VAEVDTSLTQVLSRSEGLHRVSEDGARASVSLAEGASVLDGTLEALVKRADELRAAAQRSQEAVTRVAASAHESSGHAAHAATEAERGAHVVRGVREAIEDEAAQQTSAATGAAVSIADVKMGLDSLAEEGRRNAREAERIRDLAAHLRDLAGFVERTVHEQKGAASQIAVAADRSLSHV